MPQKVKAEIEAPGQFRGRFRESWQLNDVELDLFRQRKCMRLLGSGDNECSKCSGRWRNSTGRRGIDKPHNCRTSGIADDHAVIRQRLGEVVAQQVALRKPALHVGSIA